MQCTVRTPKSNRVTHNLPLERVRLYSLYRLAGISANEGRECSVGNIRDGDLLGLDALVVAHAARHRGAQSDKEWETRAHVRLTISSVSVGPPPRDTVIDVCGTRRRDGYTVVELSR